MKTEKMNPTRILIGLFFIISLGNTMAYAEDTLQPCGKIPPEHSKHSFSQTSYAIVTPCKKPFTKSENLYIAGVSISLAKSCGFPKNQRLRKRLTDFHQSSLTVAGLGSQYSSKNLTESIADNLASAESLRLGISAGGALGCNAQSNHIAINIAKYFAKPYRQKSNVSERFVNGCVKHYARSYKYSKNQCQCLADNGRAVIPKIHESNFSPNTIKKIISSNPMLGLSLSLKCKINNY